jgi:hypothetical protein
MKKKADIIRQRDELVQEKTRLLANLEHGNFSTRERRAVASDKIHEHWQLINWLNWVLDKDA